MIVQSDFDRLCLVLRDSTPESIVKDLQTKGSVILSGARAAQRYKQASARSPAPVSALPADLQALLPPPSLLHQCLMHMAATRFELPLAVVKHSAALHAPEERYFNTLSLMSQVH
jgi:hypothetical protein